MLLPCAVGPQQPPFGQGRILVRGGPLLVAPEHHGGRDRPSGWKAGRKTPHGVDRRLLEGHCNRKVRVIRGAAGKRMVFSRDPPRHVGIIIYAFLI